MKLRLFIGISLLITGILVRVLSDFDLIALMLILAGVVLKITYVVLKIQQGEYKPGLEMALPFVGFTLFMSGIYIRAYGGPVNYMYLMIPGMILKLSFVIIFIIKSGKNRALK